MPLTLTMHPGSDGDALTLSWGAPDAPLHHALIDLGRQGDYANLRPWLEQTRNLALFVVTHIDADHIEGAMPLAAEATPPFAPADVWFNAHDHLKQARDRLNLRETLSVLQGEKLSRAIRRFGWPWNAACRWPGVDRQPRGGPSAGCAGVGPNAAVAIGHRVIGAGGGLGCRPGRGQPAHRR